MSGPVISHNDQISSKTLLEDYNPVHQLFSAYAKEIGVEFPLEDKDYLVIIQTGLSMVPVIGGALSSCFGIIWSKFFPAQEKYVTIESFEKRISQLYKDMEKRVNASIDKRSSEWCNAKFRVILKGGELFKHAINTYLDTKRNGTYHGLEKTKVVAFMNAHHAVFMNSLEEALIFFSDEKHVKFTIKLFLETAAIYIAFLKDSITFGKEWMPAVFIDGGPHVPSMAKRLHDTTANVFSTYKLFLQQFKTDEEKKKIPDWSILVANYLHGDLTLYKSQVKWVKQLTYYQGLSSFILPKDIVNPIIFSIDCTKVGLMCEGITQAWTENFHPFGQSCDYITNTLDYRYVPGEQRKKVLIYFTLYDNVTRPMSFRFYLSNTENHYNDYELTVRELDPTKVDLTKKEGFHPDDTHKICLKEHKDKMVNSKPFTSPFSDKLELYSSKTLNLEKSKIYYVEFASSTTNNLGSAFHRIDIICDASTDKQALTSGEDRSINIDQPIEKGDGVIDLAKLGADYLAAEAHFKTNNALGKVGLKLPW